MRMAIGSGAAVVALLWFLGAHHFVYGSRQSLTMESKVSWSLSETVVNLDEVKALPPMAARERYPLFYEFLRRP